ncbi:MAG: hypothetical protein RSD22_06045 [Romboutsia sp.]
MNKTLKVKDILTIKEVSEILNMRYETILKILILVIRIKFGYNISNPLSMIKNY